MRTDSVKKYVIPNIPYLFILWACLKLGTAYRLAPGADFAHKLMGLGQSIGPAFADFAPGLHPLDWLIGIVGAVGFRLLIYFRWRSAVSAQTRGKSTGRSPRTGKIRALQESAALFNFLNSNGIQSMQQLHEKIADMNSRYYDLRRKIVKAERRITVPY